MRTTAPILVALLLTAFACESLETDEASYAISTNSPGGKKYYMAAMTRLNTSDDIVRVGRLVFFASVPGQYLTPSRKVVWVGWSWRENAPSYAYDYCGPICAEGIGTSVGADCPQTGQWQSCDETPKDTYNIGLTAQQPAIGELRAAYGWKDAPPEYWVGDYHVIDDLTPNVLRIEWHHGGWDYWQLTDTAPGIQKLELQSSSTFYTDGVAAGSNQPYSTRVHPATIMNTHPGFGPGSEIQNFDGHTQCSTATWVIENRPDRPEVESPCTCYTPTGVLNKHSHINNWIARVGFADRRDTWHSWCQCLAFANPWYYGGSHQRMLLQAIDDSGQFRGWVGVGLDRNFDGAALLEFLDF